ncbi:MAG: DNA polymerase ligase N-terminal domain-containing protein, partial [Pseudolabrys sp.]
MRERKKSGLKTYQAKRRFGVTAEPKGKVARKRGNAFVIQKHAARRLHYDLRLELDGVMKSWAVTRGPSLVPGEKRLAVQVEDHPISYNKFEGTIPQGEYGGGTVMIWDRGHWQPEDDPHKGLAKGHLAFTLDGEKLSGGWHLVRMHRRPGEKRDNWLLIKQHDEAERSANDEDILEEQPRSVVTGRTMDEIAKGPKREWRSNRSKAAQPKIRSSKATKKSTTRKRAPAAATNPLRRRASLTPPRNDPLAGARASALPAFVAPCLATL